MTTALSALLKSYPTGGGGSGGGGSPVVIKNLGEWDAYANLTSTWIMLQSGVGEEGGFYVVSKAGTTELDGVTDWEVGQMALFLGGKWIKYDLTKIYNFDSPLLLEAGHVKLETDTTLALNALRQLHVPITNHSLKIYQNLVVPGDTLPWAIDLGVYYWGSSPGDGFKTMNRPAFVAIQNGQLPQDDQLPNDQDNKYGCILGGYNFNPGSDYHAFMFMVNCVSGNLYLKTSRGDDDWKTNVSLQFYNTNQTGLLSSLLTSSKSSLVNAINELKDNQGDLDSLTTADKSTLIAAINEINAKLPLVFTSPLTQSDLTVALSYSNAFSLKNNKLDIPLGSGLNIYTNLVTPSATLPFAMDLGFVNNSEWVADNFKAIKRPSFLAVFNEYFQAADKLPVDGKYGAVMLPYQTSADPHIAMLLVHTTTGDFFIKTTSGNDNWTANAALQVYNTKQTGKLSDLKTTNKSTLVAAINELHDAEPEALTFLAPLYKKQDDEVWLQYDDTLTVTDVEGSKYLSVILNPIAPLFINAQRELSIKTDETLAVTGEGELTANIEFQSPLNITGNSVALYTDRTLSSDGGDLGLSYLSGLRLYTNSIDPSGSSKTGIDLNFYSDAQWVADNFKALNRPAFLRVYNQYLQASDRFPVDGKYASLLLPYQTGGDDHSAMLNVNTTTGDFFIKTTSGDDTWQANVALQVYNTKQTGKLADLTTTNKSTLVAAINEVKPNTNVTSVDTQWAGAIADTNVKVYYLKVGRMVTLTFGQLGTPTAGVPGQVTLTNKESSILLKAILPIALQPLYPSSETPLHLTSSIPAEVYKIYPQEPPLQDNSKVPLTLKIHNSSGGINIEVVESRSNSIQKWDPESISVCWDNFCFSYIAATDTPI